MVKDPQAVFCWLEGMEAKVTGTGELFDRVEFDKLLQNYSAVTDTPCVNHYKELVEAYPDAKVILTTRDPKKWIESTNNSFYNILNFRIWIILEYIGTKLQQRKQLAMRELLRLALIDWSGGRWEDREALKAGFVAHNNNIRRLVPSEILLEFSPKQGWAPLCEFLGKEIPNEPFPYVNKGDHSTNIFFAAIVVRLVTSYWMHAIGLSGAVVALVWMWRS